MEVKILTANQVCERLGIGRTTLWQIEKSIDFPKPFKIGKANARYLASELDEWIERQAAKRK